MPAEGDPYIHRGHEYSSSHTRAPFAWAPSGGGDPEPWAVPPAASAGSEASAASDTPTAPSAAISRATASCTKPGFKFGRACSTARRPVVSSQ